MSLESRIIEAYERHPFKPGKYEYGTAGFRMKSHLLDSIMFTVGLLACLRSHADNGKASGVMITASHNPIEDNGVKIVNQDGEMLPQEWEKYAIKLANSSNGKELFEAFSEVAKETGNEAILTDKSNPILVYIGKDTRPSSEALSASVIDGIKSLPNAKFFDFGVVTTPQLHWVVWRGNEENVQKTIENYYESTARSFSRLLDPSQKSTSRRQVFVDCANGVGGATMRKLEPHLKLLDITLLNESDLSLLNAGCGAEFVQKSRKFPSNFDKSNGTVISLDGDADRVVISYKKKDGSFGLLDGDKIATLFGKFVAELFTKNKLDCNLGVVQTAYANGASTKYLKSVLNPSNVACVATGVKHLHHKAKDFDVGVYFEANGHGTVTFTREAFKSVQDATQNVSDDSQIRLRSFFDLINPVVGDAICDFLAVEAVLDYYGWDYETWDNELYVDLPSVQTKLKVKDRRVVVTTSDETKVTSPDGFQNKLEKISAAYNKGRSFVRPSGTEDVVRVYAEAETEQEAKSLAQDVLKLVYDDLQGTEQPPTL
ncbi:phosphoacetylglucosamine mutase [Acrasis kona]|uniref:Phosphoacetylglucosamine mutase n=1 Tax=Acrasis kona TaxID=1008807 RepID=A0AAW2YSK3_9EUKA